MLRVDFLLFMLFLLSSCGVLLPDKGHLGQPCTDGGVCVDGSECVDDRCVNIETVDGDHEFNSDEDIEPDDADNLPDGDQDDDILVDGDTIDDDNPSTSGKIGAACEIDDDCESQYCLTEEIISELLGAKITIPNGYCSNLVIFGTDCDSEVCNDSTGGVCMRSGFIGPSYVDLINICLRPCDFIGDCRIADSNICMDPQDWVDEERLTSAAKEEYFGNLKLCVPSDLVNMIEEEMRSAADQ